MDYQTQQYKLLPLLASAYALSSTGVAMMMMFVQVRGQIEEGNLDSLPEVRAAALPPLPPPPPLSSSLTLTHTLSRFLSHTLSLMHPHSHTQLHATSAGLKAISAEISNNGIEVSKL